MIVRDAARATFAAGTARVRQVRFHAGTGAVISSEEGESEFARRRTRTTIEHSVPDRLRELFERIEGRWPWLDDGEPAAGPAQMLHAGTVSWVIIDGSPSSLRGGSVDDRRRIHTDPTWILGVVEHARREVQHGEDHYGFVTDLLETGDAIVPPPHPWRRAPRIAGDARLDAAGRIVHATWRRVDRVRPRGVEPYPVTWTSTDLWDFGLPVELSVPDAERDPPLPLMLAHLGWRLWRRKRAYERRCSPTE